MRAGLLIRVSRVAAASCGATVVPMPAVRDLPLLADVADCQCRDGGPELVIRRKHPVVAMPVLPRRRDEIGGPVQKLKRRDFDDAIHPRLRGFSLSAGPAPGPFRETSRVDLDSPKGSTSKDVVCSVTKRILRRVWRVRYDQKRLVALQ